MIESDWAKSHPTDLGFREIEPILHKMAGDEAGWERSRQELLVTWGQMRGSASLPPPIKPGFTIDILKLNNNYMLYVDQCYEPAGKFGVLYKFSVVGPGHKTVAFST